MEDDITGQREIAYLLLTHLGYKVQTVNSVEKAIDFSCYNKVDILILAMIMPPGIDGLGEMTFPSWLLENSL